MFNEGRLVVAGDATLFVSEAGNSNGQPIILLHGGMGSRADFAPLARLMAADYRLIAVDSRGHGRSSLGQTAMTYRQLAQDIAAIVERLGLGEVGIIGHSDGGIVALRIAAFGLFQPRFVVAVGAHWQLPDDDPTRGIFQATSAKDWREMYGAQIARYENENPTPDFVRLFDATRAMWLGNGPDDYPGEVVSKITSPLLVVRGDNDIIVSRAHAFETAERVSGARLLNLPFASHAVLEESPADLLPSLVSFISSV